MTAAMAEFTLARAAAAFSGLFWRMLKSRSSICRNGRGYHLAPRREDVCGGCPLETDPALACDESPLPPRRHITEDCPSRSLGIGMYRAAQEGGGRGRTDFTREVTSNLPDPLASARLFRSKRRVPTWRRSCEREEAHRWASVSGGSDVRESERHERPVGREVPLTSLRAWVQYFLPTYSVTSAFTRFCSVKQSAIKIYQSVGEQWEARTGRVDEADWISLSQDQALGDWDTGRTHQGLRRAGLGGRDIELLVGEAGRAVAARLLGDRVVARLSETRMRIAAVSHRAGPFPMWTTATD